MIEDGIDLENAYGWCGKKLAMMTRKELLAALIWMIRDKHANSIEHMAQLRVLAGGKR